MEKEQRVREETDRLTNNARHSGIIGTANNVPLANGINTDTPKPYRRTRNLSRYNNAFKNLIPIRAYDNSTGKMPIDHIGLYTTVFGGWMTKYLWKAYRGGGINMSDLPTISPYDSCEYNAQRLEILWNDEVAKNGLEGASFSRAAWRFVRTRSIASSFLLAIALILGFISPVCSLSSNSAWVTYRCPKPNRVQYAT